MRTVDVAERRARLVRRHGLLGDRLEGGVVALAERLVGLHATDPATPHLSAWARLPGFTPAELEVALYGDERRAPVLRKHLAMRRTLFVLPEHLLGVVQAAVTDGVLANERRRTVADVERSGIAAPGEGAAWLARAEAATLAALRRGPLTGAQLTRAVPELQAKITAAEGVRWGADVGVGGRVTTIVAASRKVRRGRPGPGWTSSLHRWERAPAPGRTPAVGPATDALVQRWLRAFGPATVADVVWWTGLGVTRVRPALARLGVVPVDLDGEAGVVLPDDVEPEPAVPPVARLLPGLDSTTMGWKQRAWYLGVHGPVLFDRNGNAGPTVWWDGRVVGGWAQRGDGEVAVRLLEDVGADGAAAVAAEADRLQTWLGSARVRSRFPTPTEVDLRH